VPSQDVFGHSASRSHSDMKKASKEDLIYAVRWMVFIRPFGPGVIRVWRMHFKTGVRNLALYHLLAAHSEL
jgi:hypothetical protein